MRASPTNGRHEHRSAEASSPDRHARPATGEPLRASWSGQLAGHAWTVGPAFLNLAWPPPAPPTAPWSATVHDSKVGAIRLSGQWSEVRGSQTAVLIVHGLGGDAASPYVVRAAQEARRAGLSSLRLALRGADRSGEDLYHAGLHEDLLAALRSPELQPFRHVVLLGYSLGGHLCLHAALHRGDERLRAVAAICPPLDLAAVQRALDSPRGWLYRRHVMAPLHECYRAVARRRAVPVPPERVDRANTVREFDRLVVVPRFGFRDVDDYYACASVGPHLAGLTLPTLLVASRWDPMVPAHTLEPALRGAGAALDVRWLDVGGHLYFPHDAPVTPQGVGSAARQVMAWLKACCG